MAHGIARIRLDDGTPVWARVSDAEELGRGGGFQDTGVRDRVVSMAGGLTDVVRGVVGSLRAGLDPQGPVEVAVSFGIELSAQSGKVIGVLADGAGKASVNVSLTWTEPGPATAPAATAETSPATEPATVSASEPATVSTSGSAAVSASEPATVSTSGSADPAPGSAGPAPGSAGPATGAAPGSAGSEVAERRSGIVPQRRPAADGTA
ncbi:CU044_2847 family protein [Streptomyces sp. NPDC015661]|uniref:CU044_2847 family protein n=1 Tax=Streptomyces sp. NPDC015661 TaxID=3364961 RepID=UPI0036FDC522